MLGSVLPSVMNQHSILPAAAGVLKLTQDLNTLVGWLLLINLRTCSLDRQGWTGDQRGHCTFKQQRSLHLGQEVRVYFVYRCYSTNEEDGYHHLLLRGQNMQDITAVEHGVIFGGKNLYPSFIQQTYFRLNGSICTLLGNLILQIKFPNILFFLYFISKAFILSLEDIMISWKEFEL